MEGKTGKIQNKGNKEQMSWHSANSTEPNFFPHHNITIHSKSEKVCGTAFSVKKKLRKKCINPGVIFGPFGVIVGHFGSFLGHFGSF